MKLSRGGLTPRRYPNAGIRGPPGRAAGAPVATPTQAAGLGPRAEAHQPRYHRRFVSRCRLTAAAARRGVAATQCCPTVFLWGGPAQSLLTKLDYRQIVTCSSIVWPSGPLRTPAASRFYDPRFPLLRPASIALNLG